MFLFAFLVGIYSYIIFLLGVSGYLYREVVIGTTAIFILLSLKVFKLSTHQIIKLLKYKIRLEDFRPYNFKTIFIILLVLQTVVNLIGTLGPELAFDALWYHLTLPKLYLQNHSISFIPGGLLYYSAMPKLAEMIYVVGLSFGNEITVKFIHFGFGLLTCLALYKLSRKFFTPLISLIGVVIFYSNMVVAWESITAYVDLIRTFFEVMALWCFMNWWEFQKRKWLVWSALMLGFAITTKLLAIGSLLIFTILIILKRKALMTNILVYWSFALLIPSPWFIFSYIHTSNPIYPIFSTYLDNLTPKIFSLSTLNPFEFIYSVWNILTKAADPVSPIYIIMLPMIVWLFSRGEIRKIRGIRIIGLYAIFGIFVWYVTSKVEGSRLLISYLPAFSILCAAGYSNILKNVRIMNFGKIIISIIIFISMISIGYRFVANSKYLPVIFGIQSKAEFLAKNLNFNFGDFYDTDGYFKKNIKTTDTVLLYGFHNLYYVDFPFIDSSWMKKDDKFNYIATQKTEIPEKFSNWTLIYKNEQTMVKLYKKTSP